MQPNSWKEWPARLGFVETEELVARRQAVVAAIKTGKAPEIQQAAWSDYCDLAEPLADACPDNPAVNNRLHLGLLMAKTNIWWEAEEAQQWFFYLLDVAEMAEQLGEDELAGAIEALCEEVISELGL